jgi:adenine-specific DNA methylase
LEIPLSTNFFIVKRKGKPADDLAAFPEVPSREQGNRCTFRVVGPAEWKDCRWPRPDFEQWHPTETPTFKDGKATCPRCGHVAEGEEVKAEAKKGPGGLPSQMYAVCSQVPVLLTYRNGEQKVRYLWRFRPPTEEDLAAVRAAEAEVARLRAKWAAEDLVPTEEIPEGEKTREPRNMGMTRWSDLFLPRQLLTAVTVLEEIRAAQARAQAELPAHEAEAISVYLSFMLSKVLNYNSVNTFWHYGRRQVAQSFSRHDFAFRPAFCEFEGARETVKWAASQVLGAYAQLAGLIHGAAVELSGGDDEGEPEDAVGEVESDATDEDAAHAVPAEPMTAGPANFRLRPEVIVPTVTCEDAAALSEPKPGTVHLICVDPPYYSNLQYAELSNFFYVWLKRALRGWPGLAHLFREPLAETNREAVANGARWKRDADEDLAAWRARYDEEFGCLRVKVKAAAAKKLAVAAAGPKPPTAKDRADRFYEDKMAAVFRRARQLLHPAGRMVVMFNHKETEAWQSLGMALIRAGFEIRSSVPIHTEAESSLNIRGLDAVRSTVLLLCLPREEAEQPVGNWTTVQSQVARTARGAAEKFQKDGLSGTDLYLSTLGPVLRVVGQQWPVTDFAGRPIDLEAALNEAYKAVGQWRLEQVFAELTKLASFANVGDGFSAEGADRDSQILWLWLDTFQGPVASSDDVRKMAKALNIDPNEFGRIGLIRTEKDMFILRAPQEVDLGRLSFHLASGELPRGRRTAGGDAWEKRTFPNFVGAAVWNAIALMAGTGVQAEARGPEALRRWLSESGYGLQREFRGAFAITLHLLETAFPPRQGDDDTGDSWREAVRQGKRAWDLVIQSWRT